ncbi:MAG TPA: glycosyltransferase family 39 protein, partial [Chloroflexota bacterium]|nr:glycosyltransferase family 39 protein [Chloroflexota bacterium]
MALWTQLAVFRGASGEQALLGFGLGSALFAYGLSRAANTTFLRWQESAEPSDSATAGISRPLAIAALALGLVTFVASGDNRFGVLNTTTWLASIGLGLAAAWDPPPRLPRWKAFRWPTGQTGRLTLSLSGWDVALAVVVAIGTFLLFYRIGDVPPEMQSDHAEKLLDVQDLLNGEHRIFFPRNTGREAFQFYWIALLTPLLGLTYLNMKVGTALLGMVTIPLVFFLGRRFFGPPVGVTAAAVLAFSRWHLLISRRGLRFPFPELFGAAIYYFLFRALRDRRRNDFLLCGLMLGIAQHTYIPLRFAPFAVLLCVAIALLVDIRRRAPARRQRRLLLDTGLLLAVAGLVFVPLGRYATQHPAIFLFRGLSRIAGESTAAPPPDSVRVLITNTKNALAAFNWRGDTAWVNNVPLEPFLDPLSGALFVLGCVYCVYRLVRFREALFGMLLLLIPVGLAPSIISIAFPQENPATARSAMAGPVVALIVALAVQMLARRVRILVGGAAGAAAAGASTALVLASMLQLNFHEYFDVYPKQYQKATQHTEPVASVANGFFALGGARQDAHIVLWPHWIDARSVAIQTGQPYWDPVIATADDALKQDGAPRTRLYVVHPADKASLDKFSRWYPGAITSEHRLAVLD